jgi:hypothetical protein
MPDAILAVGLSDERERGIVIRNTIVLSACILFLVGLSTAAYDRAEFLFLDEIEIGMTGVGRTVVSEDAITEFAVEILGVIDQPGDLSDFVAVRVSGEAVGRSGGIAQGMSGSPIYVDGKMIGALSRSASWSKDLTPIGLVTPIEPMLAVLDSSSEGAFARASEHAILRDVRLIETTTAPTETELAATPDALFSYPVSAPLLTQGLSERSQELLMHGFEDRPDEILLIHDVYSSSLSPHPRGLSALGLSLIPAAAAAPASRIDPSSLEPGSGIGVALATGDITIGALGTLTYREGDDLVGFGHRFIYNGPSAFPMTTVSIIDTMKAYDASFKLGSLGEIVGTISEDRIAAIGGTIGETPQGIDLALVAVDTASYRQGAFSVQLVDEPRLMPELLLSTGFEAIDSTLDRIGQGTVVVDYVIEGDAMPEPLMRRDVFFSSVDVAVYPPLQLASIVAALQYNEFTDPEITQVGASMEFSEEIDAILIGDLEIDWLTYEPGEAIRFSVTLQTFQGERITREGEILIPEDLFADYLLVRAYGGPRRLESGETAEVFESLDDLVAAIESFPSYETLTVELFAIDPFSAYSDALYGVDEVTFEFPGQAVIGEREVSALLFYSEGETDSEDGG